MSDHVIGDDAPPWQQLSWNLQRNRRNMLGALLGCTILFGGIALVMPAAYRSNSELMVRLGQEYLVNADPASTSVFMERKEMVVSEVAMLTAPELAMRVLREVGLPRVYPGLADEIVPGDKESETIGL